MLLDSDPTVCRDCAPGPAARSTGPREALATAGAFLLPVGFCGLLLLLDPRWFWHDDFQTYQLANYWDLARSWAAGEFLLLSPYSWQSGALAGEYQNGVFSVVLTAGALLVTGLGLSLPAAAAALSAVHLGVLSAGTFRLGRRRGLPTDLAVLAALVATLSGWTMIWGARAWFPALASFAWLPWFWWALERGLADRRGVARFAVPGVFLYLIVTAGWPFTVLMAGVVSGGLALRGLRAGGGWGTVGLLAVAWGVGLGLSAPAWLLLVEYTAESVRGQTSPLTLNMTWTVPPSALLGLAFPAVTTDWPVFVTWQPHANLELTGGLVPLAALVAAACAFGRKAVRRCEWEAALAVLALALAMLPSPGVFRWSFRWLPLFSLALGLVAAHVLARLRAAGPGRPNPGRWAAFLVALVWPLALALNPSEIIVVLGATQTALALLWAAAEQCLAPASAVRRWFPCAFFLAAAGVTYGSADRFVEVPGWDPDSVAAPGALDPAVRYFNLYALEDLLAPAAEAPEPRFGAGSGPLPGNAPLYAGREFVNGYSPVQPRGLAEVFGFGEHGYLRHPSAAADRLPAQARPGGLLDLMAVDGIVLAGRFAGTGPALEANGWQRHSTLGSSTVYHRRSAPSPRVRALTQVARTGDRGAAMTQLRGRSADAPPALLSPGAPAEPGAEHFGAAQVALTHESRNAARAEVVSADPARDTLVVFARPWYPGYRATFNGRPVAVERVDLILPAVRVPAGATGVLVLDYAPRSLAAGAALAGLTGLGLVALMLCAAHRRAGARPASPRRSADD